ncbi:MAG: hypothetical protein H7301_03285 [Cryobacterium sp.]|nr:hypothetical protein [Oligoflexia bacterium]
MRNMKKTFLKTNALLGLTVLAAMSLSACGRSDYNGTYTGYQTSVAPAAGSTQSNYPSYQSQSAGVVQASLTSNGDSVTGTYNLTSSGGNTGSYYQSASSGGSYQLQASSVNSNSLTNVMLIPTSQSYGGCTLTGSLTSSNGGKSLSGTLNPLGQTQNTGYSTCQAVQINLTRNN